jgi:L-asparagine transporter-like permease
MNDCCNGSSDQKECCKSAVEAYKQELIKQEAQENKEYELRFLEVSSWMYSVLAGIVVLVLIVQPPAPWNINLGWSLVAILLCCVVIWKKRKDIKAIKQEIASE